ncbi:carboxylesterase 5A-like isoform X1 [Clupea harengus]|uniref:Carboxylic ester hydrolase n=1 Tax=Clupea harengus TaxID=7950 RepID=A0A6P3W2X6_CLUHA|nr:carboxylesterase 5A-like isoform X1 [Clupea harengus]
MRGVLICVFLTLSAIIQTSLAQSGPGPVVSVRNGTLRGASMTVKGSDKQVQQYLGIPFARPPLGPLRLSAPQPAESWEGERDATQQPPMCLQDPDIVTSTAKALVMVFTPPGISEDCLYVNVYTPAKPLSGEKLPVMVWIHGGGLYMGGAFQYDGSVLAAYENIVVVAIQYRLGFLGFFSTGDEHAQGNWGFLDQIAALQWVQENIESFGGDPNSVTIAGESAGGISASLLILSPLAKGLFHRATLQSGAGTLGAYTTKTPLVYAKMVANVTECDSSSTEELVKCMRQKTPEDFVTAMKKKKIFMGGVVDGVFLNDVAEEVLKSKDFLKVPILVGVVNHEFGWILPNAFAPPGWHQGMTRETFLAMVNTFFSAGKATGANELIVDEYLKDAHTPEDIRNEFTEALSDLFMVVPIIKVAGYHRDAGVPVYMYEFQHRPEIYKDTRPSFVKADHADDVGFVFGACFWNGHIKINGTTTEEENQLCKTMMAYWGNFVRTGSPNGPGLVHWPLYDASNKYLNLDLQQSEGQDLRKEKIQFFTVELPKRLAAKQEQLQK